MLFTIESPSASPMQDAKQSPFKTEINIEEDEINDINGTREDSTTQSEEKQLHLL